jgi:hypothetical protein
MENLLDKWLRLPAEERALAIRTGLLQVAVGLGLKALPFKTLLRLLRWTAVKFKASNPAGEIYGERVARIAGSIGRRLPGDRPCLGQALTVQWFYLRNRMPAELVIGVAKSQNGQLVAHAWVESCGTIVIGGTAHDVQEYTRLPNLDGGLL